MKLNNGPDSRRKKLSKLTMVAAILALVLLSIPAMAADFEANGSVSNSGDYARQCTPDEQAGNVGNFKNRPGNFRQFPNSELDDFEPGGSALTFGPSQSASCNRQVQQSSSSSS
jgi:hypothetical protein